MVQANGRSRIVTIGKQSEALTAVPRQTFTIKLMSGPRVQDFGNSQNKFLRVEAIKLRTAALCRAQQAYINYSCGCWKKFHLVSSIIHFDLTMTLTKPEVFIKEGRSKIEGVKLLNQG